MHGYTGKLLFVDLDGHGTISTEELNYEDAKNFLGGPGLGAKILYDNMPAKTPVFDKESMIGFVTGPLNNSNALYGGRYTVVCKSPVTGGWNDANSSGFFGNRLKRSGYDAVFVKGIAKHPVYIFIDNGKAKIMDAQDLWGRTTKNVEDILMKRHGKNVGIALIGPAGENLSYISAVMNDGHRAAARGGPGAVMGSKNLKAIVVKGSKPTWAAHPFKVLKIDLECLLYMHKMQKENEEIKDFPIHGTGGSYKNSVKINDAGIKNWTGSPHDKDGYSGHDAKELESKSMDKYKVKKFHCPKCPIGCSIFMKVETKRWGVINTTRPEYETMGSFGSLLANKDVESVIMANELCNEYGFDTMSAGSTIAWAMECYENGELTKEDLDGIELKWGAGSAVINILKKMGENDGVGAILLKGSREAARLFKEKKGESFGGEKYLVIAGGIEIPQHDSRLLYPLGRTYLADPTPGRHVKAGIGGLTTDEDFDPKKSMQGTGQEEIRAIIRTEIMNSSGSCAFGFDYGNPNDAVYRSISAVTGFNYSADEISQLGLRMFTMRQAFNIREGIRRGDITISERMKKGKPPFKGKLENISLDFEGMVDNLYNALGWTKEGIPELRALQSLNSGNDDAMQAVINDLYPKLKTYNESLDSDDSEAKEEECENVRISKYFSAGYKS